MKSAVLQYDTATCTDPGSHRFNQDDVRFSVWPGGGIWTVADGLGSNPDSHVSARVATEASIDLFDVGRASADLGPVLERMGAGAHERVRAAQVERGLPGIRTTIAALAFDGLHAQWMHVGDTRVYHWSADRLRARTLDQSVPQMLVEMGTIGESEVRNHVDRSRLLAALGQEGSPRVVVSQAVPIRAGDAYLICTDGWWEAVSDEDMLADLRTTRCATEWLARMRRRIARLRRKGQDNYTALGVRIVEGP